MHALKEKWGKFVYLFILLFVKKLKSKSSFMAQ